MSWRRIVIGGSWVSDMKVERTGKVKHFSVPIQSKFCRFHDRCPPYVTETYWTRLWCWRERRYLTDVAHLLNNLYKIYPVTSLGMRLGLQKVEAPRFSRQAERECSKFVSPTHRLPLPSSRYPLYSCLLQAESTPGLKLRPVGSGQWQSPMTPSGIEPVTSRLVAKFLNQLRRRIPKTVIILLNHIEALLIGCCFVKEIQSRANWIAFGREERKV